MVKLTEEEAREIRAARVDKWVPLSSLQNQYHISAQTLKSVLSNELYHDPSYDPADQKRNPGPLYEKLRSDTGIPYELPETRTPYVVYGLYCICRECERDIPGMIRYVGQARRGLAHRMSSHFTVVELNSDYPSTRWKVKHGRNNIRVSVLDVVDTPEDLDKSEIYWIEKLNTLSSSNPYGLNLVTGGQFGWMMSPEARERLRKNRSGENSRFARLNWEQVRDIRARHLAGERSSVIARSLPDVSEGTVNSIVGNKTWVDPEYTPRISKMPRGDEKPESKLTWDDVKYIRENHEKEAECAKMLNVSRSLINLVRTNKVWVDPDYVYTPKVHPFKKGEEHHNSKLDWDSVMAIRSSSGTYKEIGQRFGVSQSLIMGIKLNRMWHDPDYQAPPARGRGGRKKKIRVE